MKKSDIVIRSKNPAINVKHHLWLPDLIRRYRDDGHEFSGDQAFWEWVEALYDNDSHEYFDDANEWARESCWELAQQYALEVWPEMTAKVYSDGRSGGWLVVHGLPDVETWDAVDVAKWAKFHKLIRGLVDDGYPYDFIWHLHVNVYEPVVLEPAREAAEYGLNRDAEMWDAITAST